MIGGFFTALFSGHLYIIAIITGIQIVSFKEVIAIANVPSKAKNLRFTRSLNWYFLGTTMYFLYGESVIYYFKHILLVDKVLLPFATHHRFISFMLYVIGKPHVHEICSRPWRKGTIADSETTGFVFFVGSLQNGHYRFQFTQFAWTHMALYLIVVQAHFVMNNLFEGLVWFFLPASLVITNDIFAYICGMAFGRTQLIKLSPKKTVEGFVGAWICTIVFGFGVINVLMRYKYFICPVNVSRISYFQALQRSCDAERYSDSSCRISARTSSQDSLALQTRSSSHKLTAFPPCFPIYQSPAPSPSLQSFTSLPCNSTSSSSQHLPLSSHPSAASSPRASNGRSRSKTLASPFPDMAVLQTVWTANSSWGSLPLCIIRVSLPCTKRVLGT